MQISYADRLVRGYQVEDEFIKYVNSQSLWKAHPYGQRYCSRELQEDLRGSDICVKSEYATRMIELLPEDWRHIYKRGLATSFPLLCRWDADAFCVFNKTPQFFAEIKSSITKSNNVAIEISCYLAALINRDRLGLPFYFVFSPNEINPNWSYVKLEDLPDCVCRVFDGRNTNGSSKPFLLIPKERLYSNLDHLLLAHQDAWPL